MTRAEFSSANDRQITLDEVRYYYGQYITVTYGMSGWFAVCLWWNPEGFWEPWNTGFGRYRTADKARKEAKDWAEADELPYLE